MVQLISSLRKILLRNAIIGSKYANCITSEESSAGSIFYLKWGKRRPPLVENEIFDEDNQEMKKLASCFQSYTLTTYIESILGYIARFIVRKLTNGIDSATCNQALYLHQGSMPKTSGHYYSSFSGPKYLSLINTKNGG